MTRLELLPPLLAVKALLESNKQEKSLELINELIEEVKNTTNSSDS